MCVCVRERERERERGRQSEREIKNVSTAIATGSWLEDLEREGMRDRKTEEREGGSKL